jgi:ABC-type uncharacterized transport system auxiliary subunit
MVVFLLFGLCLVLNSGCAGIKQQARETLYYTFDYAPPKATGKKTMPVSIRIERFLISPEYDTDRIVYSSKKHLRQTYNYHRWRSNPRDLVTYYLTRDFSRSRLFNSVFYYQTLYPASYTVSGTIDELYESDEDPWKAVLTLNIVVLKERETDKDKRIFFQKTYSVVKNCDNETPQAFVHSMGDAMSAVSGLIVTDIYNHFTDNNASTGP